MDEVSLERSKEDERAIQLVEGLTSHLLPAADSLSERPGIASWWRTVSGRTRRGFIGEIERGALGCTPLHLACDGGHAELVSLLLAHGADPYASVYLDATCVISLMTSCTLAGRRLGSRSSRRMTRASNLFGRFSSGRGAANDMGG